MRHLARDIVETKAMTHAVFYICTCALTHPPGIRLILLTYRHQEIFLSSRDFETRNREANT